MTARTLLLDAARRLKEAGVPDAAYDAAILLSRVTGEPPLQLRAGFDLIVAEEQLQAFEALMVRRMAREPLQYLLGDALFLGMPFRVRPGVLIPRPETELLARSAIRWIAKREEGKNLSGMDTPHREGKRKTRVLDLCCGSGCLGISVAKHCPAADCTLSDYSPQALAVARENAEQLGVRCLFLEGDLFAPMAEQRFDLILSNPPYIPSGACDTLQPEVCREPRMALDGGADGLDFYRRIAREAPAHLYSGGSVMLEVGDGEAEAVERLLLDHGARRCEAAEDFAGISRMVFADYGAFPEPWDRK